MFNYQIIMRIFNKINSESHTTVFSLFIINLTFFDMSKIKTKNPILKRNGVKNSFNHSLSITYIY